MIILYPKTQFSFMKHSIVNIEIKLIEIVRILMIVKVIIFKQNIVVK